MLSDLRAESDIRGQRIDLRWSWTGPGPRPELRLVRRRRAHPESIDQGLVVISLAEVYDDIDASSTRVDHSFYFASGSDTDSGRQNAELAAYFRDRAAAQPHRVRLGYFDRVAFAYRSVDLSEVSRVTHLAERVAPWQYVRTVEIFHTPGGGAEVPAGRVNIYTGHDDGVTADRFEWAAPGAAAVTVPFGRSASVLFDEAYNVDRGDWVRHLTVADYGLQPQIVYYYTLFAPAAGLQPYRTERGWRAAAMATGRHGLADQLYRRLPAIHQYYDEPEPALRGRGQLRRYLEGFGAALDHARSLADGLASRHSVPDAHVGVLPHLARWIGWDPDLTQSALWLRSDIQQAPEIFRTVGTVPNLRALVNRVTGWDCKIKEFAHNVFLTNASETIGLWEIWERAYDGLAWTGATPVTRTDGFDGCPRLVEHGGSPWLVFHSDRAGSRDLWIKPHDTATPAYRAITFVGTDGTPAIPINEYPAALSVGTRLWLFWDSNRDGPWNIWGSWDTGPRPFEHLPPEHPANLTEHAAEDRYPAAVHDVADRIWLFWQSNRRGPTDIWLRVHDGAGWGTAARVTTAQFRHEHPAVTVDGDGRIWLFYSNDLGDRRNLAVQVYHGGVWSEARAVTDGPWRDESPAAAFWNGQVWLFWHSNRNSHWQILSQPWEWNTAAGAPARAGTAFTVTADTAGNKEPAAFVDGSGNLRVLWRSQRRGRNYRSRSIDTGDAEMLARLGTYDDRAHYSYDTATTDSDWYARNTVGIYITPESERPDEVDRNRRLIEGPLRKFVPIHVRPVLFILPAVHREYVYTYDFPAVTPQRTIGEYLVTVSTAVTTEVYPGLTDAYTDTVPEWIWLRSWSLSYADHRTVDFTATPIDTTHRTWHVRLLPGG